MSERERAPLDQIGRYRVRRPLGRGAMGEVLLAHDTVLDREVALKYLRQDLNILPEQREALIERLWQEARASARVSHPNIVSLFDMGEDSVLGPFLVFERVDGTTLKDELSRGRLSPQAAARLARELGDALATAHAAGVLHRDIKPENILLSRLGAKIADFGIARLPNSNLTRGGQLLGTPAYSAPETLDGARFSAASDQFSLAATLYEATSAQRAFPGHDAIQVAGRVRNDAPLPIAEAFGLDAQVDAVLSRALSKNPTLRFADCAEFGHALSCALLGARAEQPTFGGTTADYAAPYTSAAERPRFTTRLISKQGALVGAAMTALLVYFVSSTSPQHTPASPTSLVAQTAAGAVPAATGQLAAAEERTAWVPEKPKSAPLIEEPRKAKSTALPSSKPNKAAKAASSAVVDASDRARRALKASP